MAISGADGSIILQTKVDQSGLNKGLGGIKGTITKIGKAIGVAFSVAALVNFGKAAVNLASDLQEVQNVVDTAFGDMAYKMEEFSKTAIETYGISELTAKRTASTYMAMAKGMGIAEDAGSDMALTLTGLTADMSSFYNVSQEMADTAIKSIFTGETESLKQYGIVMTEVNLEQFALSQGITKSLSAMTQQEKTMLRYNFVLEQTALAQGDFAKTSDSWANKTRVLQERWKEMQATFGETFIALGVLVLPVIEQIINGLNQIALMARAAAASFGLFKEEIKESEKTANRQVVSSNTIAGNIEQQTENQKKLNKELKKGLAGFDEINTLSSETADNTAGAGIESETSGIGVGGGTLNGSSYVEEVDATLMAIMGIVAEAMIAVGLILLFTGHIGWGIGFIIAGAATLAVTMASASEFGYDGIINMLTTIMGIAGGALLALGIILLWIGGVVGKGVAIGMIIAGGALIVSAVVAKAAFSPEDVGGWLSLIMGIAGGALLALGIILCMVGSVPLGVGMIIVGAIGLVSAVALNFDSVKNSITGWVAVIMAIAGAALLVLGIVLVATGAGLPLGIALIAVGAVALVTPIALNWSAIKEKIVSVFNVVIDWIKTYGLLVLGILLCLTGAGIPLGIALIIKWAKDGAEKGVPLATAIVDKVKEIWAAVQQFWNTHIAPIFTAEWWKNLGKKAMNGLIAGFEAGINGIIGMFEKMINWVVNGLNKISFDVPDWVPLIGGKTFGFNIPEVKFGRVSIPRLAQGAVIPPNREFLAVLGDQKQGTNIEAPLDTIVEAFKAVQGGQKVEVNFTGSLAQLARILAPEITTENSRASIFAKG